MDEVDSDSQHSYEFWQSVAQNMNWKGPISMLKDRFKRTMQAPNLSVREKQLLKKLYEKKLKNPSVTWEDILYHFPGKTIEYLKREVNSATNDSDPEIIDEKVFSITKSGTNISENGEFADAQEGPNLLLGTNSQRIRVRRSHNTN